MSQNVFAVASFDAVLILSGKVLIDASWFEQDYFEQIVVELKELSSKNVDLHDNSQRDLLSFFERKDMRLFTLLDGHKVAGGANSSELDCRVWRVLKFGLMIV